MSVRLESYCSTFSDRVASFRVLLLQLTAVHCVRWDATILQEIGATCPDAALGPGAHGCLTHHICMPTLERIKVEYFGLIPVYDLIDELCHDAGGCRFTLRRPPRLLSAFTPAAVPAKGTVSRASLQRFQVTVTW